MTAIITVKWQHPGKGAPLESQDGLLQVEPMQGWIAGDAIVNPTVEPYAVTGGTVAVEIPDDTARVWRFDHYPKRSRAFQEYRLVPPGAGAVAYTSLEKVDPETAKPTPEALANALEVVAAGTITTGQVVDGALILTRGDGQTINAGNVQGQDGADATGPTITDNGTTVTIGA